MKDGTNPLGLRSIHHVELWVGNARQAEYFYRNAMGFSRIAYAGLETGSRELTSYALRQGKANLVVSTPVGDDSSMHQHLRKHGDAVRDIAFHVADCDAAFEEAVRRGAKPFLEPHNLSDEHGTVRRAAIHTYGDTIHSLLAYKDYSGPFLPGFQVSEAAGRKAGLLRIDHIVGNVELGKMNEWADFYASVCGFHRYINFDDKDISTEYSALMSIVMSDDSQSVKFPINEPAAGRRKSQIEEYLDYNGGPGVQHIALQTRDILATVARLRDNGIEFLEVPDSYYDALPARVGHINEDTEAIRRLKVLVDRDDEGYLLQLFTRPVEDRPTLFFEIIQRAGSRGFGKGNFKALFEAIEAEQARRGNL
jgi:4-hydroxyphenylpyruvate dioxygenase